MNEDHIWEKKIFTSYHGLGHNFVDVFSGQLGQLSWHSILYETTVTTSASNISQATGMSVSKIAAQLNSPLLFNK